jgi:hypothetical protein
LAVSTSPAPAGAVPAALAAESNGSSAFFSEAR